MTAETLKPFIPNGDSLPAAHSTKTRRKRNVNCLVIGLSVASILLAIALLGIEIWHHIQMQQLQKEVQSLNKIIESMQKRLGINYLEDLQDFEEEYTNALIDDPDKIDKNLDKTDKDDNNDDDDDDDDDKDDDPDTYDDDDNSFEFTDYEDYDSLYEKYKKFNTTDDADDDSDYTEPNTSDDDNLYDDFEKYKDSKKRRKGDLRKTRSIATASNELISTIEEPLFPLNKTEESREMTEKPNAFNEKSTRLHSRLLGKKTHPHADFVANNLENRRSPLRQRTPRRHKMPTVKSARTYDSLSLNSLPFKPAAHFHLNRRIPDQNAPIKVASYRGDMYIGHPSSTTDSNIIEHYFKVENGILTVRERGLYYVYAQVCYNNTHDQNGFVIFHGHKPFLQCLNTIPTNIPIKIHTCHTSGLIYLEANETIHLRDFHSDRNVILRDTNNRSYFGLIKI